ncbi:MAG: ModD protein [Caldisphaeraceae archaeon]|nr:ModD protein [Caldisphaeraceae archaeon]
MSGCNLSMHLPENLVDEWIREDIPFMDLTTSILGIANRPAKASIILRERAVMCGLQEASAIYRRLGAFVENKIVEGTWGEPGQEPMVLQGTSGQLHAGWRVAQTLVSIGSGVATYTQLMVEKARKVNPKVIIVAARKAPPGLRHLYYHCVLCGGATPHRIGISDTVLIFPNHTRLLKGIDGVIDRIKEARSLIGERQVVVEVENLDEAIKAAKSGVIDEVQLDHVMPDKLYSFVTKIREVNDKVRIAVGGGINLDNIEKYATTGVDVIVTSAPFWARPIDLTTRIEELD